LYNTSILISIKHFQVLWCSYV